MTTLSIFTSVEFYVVTTIVAAAIVAYFAMPRQLGPVRQLLLPSVLDLDDSPQPTSTPTVTLATRPDGCVTITRRGLQDMNHTGAVSYAIEIKGFDIAITERIVDPAATGWAADRATVVIDGLAPGELYNIHIVNPALDIMASFSYRNRANNHTTRPLK